MRLLGSLTPRTKLELMITRCAFQGPKGLALGLGDIHPSHTPVDERMIGDFSPPGQSKTVCGRKPSLEFDCELRLASFSTASLIGKSFHPGAVRA